MVHAEFICCLRNVLLYLFAGLVSFMASMRKKFRQDTEAVANASAGELRTGAVPHAFH